MNEENVRFSGEHLKHFQDEKAQTIPTINLTT
jgi:hypothetical protein